MQSGANGPKLDKEYFNNAYCSMDDWRYEMRREMQEIVVNDCEKAYYFLLLYNSLCVLLLPPSLAWCLFGSLFSMSSRRTTETSGHYTRCLLCGSKWSETLSYRDISTAFRLSAVYCQWFQPTKPDSIFPQHIDIYSQCDFQWGQSGCVL